MNKILIAAMKQSQRAYLPKLNEPRSFESFVTDKNNSECFIAHCKHEDEKKYLKSTLNKGANSLILIGPEGDFSSKEIELATKQGFSTVSLGESRLRTETAAIVSCHTINLINQ
jgi:16S rRNA (uracil1498-N3)-methyltransferase